MIEDKITLQGNLSGEKKKKTGKLAIIRTGQFSVKNKFVNKDFY